MPSFGKKGWDDLGNGGYADHFSLLLMAEPFHSNSHA
jgi:hypothetical protein